MYRILRTFRRDPLHVLLESDVCINIDGVAASAADLADELPQRLVISSREHDFGAAIGRHSRRGGPDPSRVELRTDGEIPPIDETRPYTSAPATFNPFIRRRASTTVRCAVFDGVPSLMLATALSTFAAEQPGTRPPTLSYERPSGFSGGNDADAAIFVSDALDGVLGVYAFREFRGNAEGQFRQTLLREGIEASFQEDRLLEPPEFGTHSVKGADAAFFAHFKSFNHGSPREHFRMMVHAGGSVAIVDFSANSAQAFQRNWPNVIAFLKSLTVAAPGAFAGAPPSPAPRPTTGSRVAGLYLTLSRSFQPNIMGPPGSGTWVNKNEWYLLSEDGFVHHGYDIPTAPGGDIRGFDFEGARRNDPRNGGIYSVDGGVVILRIGEGPAIAASMNASGNLVVYDREFRRVQFKD
jgi:hypothetical protein